LKLKLSLSLSLSLSPFRENSKPEYNNSATSDIHKQKIGIPIARESMRLDNYTSQQLNLEL
jgi:hypothetical protein